MQLTIFQTIVTSIAYMKLGQYIGYKLAKYKITRRYKKNANNIL